MDCCKPVSDRHSQETREGFQMRMACMLARPVLVYVGSHMFAMMEMYIVSTLVRDDSKENMVCTDL